MRQQQQHLIHWSHLESLPLQHWQPFDRHKYMPNIVTNCTFLSFHKRLIAIMVHIGYVTTLKVM